MSRDKQQPQAIQLELFTNRFRAIAREMGDMLQRTALSTNVKERLDFSCAILDAGGELVVNAPHIPVHLGALGLCVRSVRATLALGPGDVAVTNHPGFGGAHLPDISVITPVFCDNTLLGYVASRAHHAEIGGTRPGSMPPNAKTLAEEGVVISPTYLLERGKPRWQEISEIFTSAPYPTRALQENLADLNAAVAANQRGAHALIGLVQMQGFEWVQYYMAALKTYAEQRIRAAFLQLPNGKYRAVEYLDDGSPLCVKINVDGDHAIFDFTGTAPTHSGNLNATPAIVRSVIIYILRLLLDEPLPLNEGLMRAVTIHLPECLLNPNFNVEPSKAPAVVGGNVETSQRLVDTLVKALGLLACGQGTMNNILFGNEQFGYYETVCGGSGAGPNFDGTDAVHTHMTNTRITDPEIIEHRYPVRLEKFAIRKDSGGNGRYRGGNGVIREIKFLAPMSLSVVTQHRKEKPFGLHGGEPGLPGEQIVKRKKGEIIKLGSVDGCEVEGGDKLILKTPGGGGYGKPG
jgi:5-oxoprolinase (ATP-hydrolysing)